MLRAAIFDLDGLLVDSEPLWRRAEIHHFATVGLSLTEADCEATTGLRIDDVVALRHRQQPWDAPSVPEITARIVEHMIALLREEAPAKRGAAHAVSVCERAGLRLAVASSSPLRLIEAALDGIGLRAAFEHVVSAEHETHGKPHPAVFLRTAERLAIAPTDCVVLEDSLPGLVAAKAARMRCIVVPERDDPRLAPGGSSLADRVLGSLAELDASVLAALGAAT